MLFDQGIVAWSMAGRRDFSLLQMSMPILGPTRWKQGTLCLSIKWEWSVRLTTHFHLVLRLRMNGGTVW